MSQADGPGDHQGELKVDDLRRNYGLHLPHSYDSRNRHRSLLAFPGRCAQGKQMEKLTNLSGLADKRGCGIIPDHSLDYYHKGV